MINITNSAIVEKIKGTGRTFTLSIKVGTNTFTKVKSLRRSSIFASNQKLSVGEAVSAFIEAEINDCRESLQNYEVEPILSIDGYDIPLGIFKVQAPSQADGSGTQKITAYDRMSETSKFTYKATGLTSAIATFSAICNICGFTAVTSGLTDVAINDRLLDGMTCREALGYVAGVFGKNCVVTTDGKFKMLGYSKVAESTCKISINSLDTLEFPSNVSRIDYFNAVVDEATTYKSGTGSNGINVVNPLFKSTSQTYSILSQLQANIGSNGYYPAKFKQLNGDPRIEVGDVIKVEHRDILTGEVIADYVPVMSSVLDYDGGVTVSIEAYATESEFSMSLSDKMNITNSSNNAKFEDLAGDIDDAKDTADRANTKADFAVVQSEAVEELNKVIGNSLGLYQTKIKGTGGDTKYYFHNKSTLESSTYIISMTDQGFAFANSWNNGNPVWTYGINPAGNSIMNYLVVNKISADLIEAGVIKSLDGAPLKSEFSLNTGLFTFEAQANKETFGFGVNRYNDLMLQYNYSDSDKRGVKLGYYYGGYFYKDAKYTEVIQPSTEYYYGDIPNDNFYEYSSGSYQKITDLTQVARTQKGFVMHPKGITIGYTVDEDGKVYSDFNYNQDFAGGNLGVTETDNTGARTPMLKYYDFEKEPSNGSEHFTAIRKQSIITKYFSAEKIAFLLESNLYDLESVLKALLSANTELNDKINILETEVQRLKETLGTKSLVVYASANPSTAGVVGGSGSYTLEDGSFLITAYPASGTEYYISSVIVTYSSDGSSQTFDQSTLISRGWLTNANTRLNMPVDITASRLGDTANVVVNFGLPSRYNLTLNVDPTSSGTVTGSGSYLPDTQVRITATPKSGYKFVGWYENGSLKFSTDTVTISMSSNRTLTAKFETEEIEVPKFTISTSVSPSGAGTVTGGGVYEKDTRQTVTATPASSEYVFKHWVVTLTDSGSTTTIEDNPCSFTVTYNASFEAVFEAVPSGELTIVAGETKLVNINAGEITYLKFTPSTSGIYEFTSLGTSDDDVVGYLYDANKSQIATDDDTAGNRQFLITQELTANTTYYWGVKYYSTSKTGSVNVKLTYNGSGGGSGETVNITIQPAFSSWGSISVNGSTATSNSTVYEFEIGDTVTLQAIQGVYGFESWEGLVGDNWETLSTNNPYTFTVTSTTPTTIRAT